MGIIPSRNLEAQRRQKGDITYFDRGIIEENGRKYARYAIQTHFVGRNESQEELVRRYVLPLYQPGDILSFGAKVMAMCVGSVYERKDVHPGFWAKLLWRFAGINTTGVGMHEPHKLQLVIDICGLPRVLWAAFLSAITRPFGKHGVFYEICGKGVGGIDGFYFRSSFELYKELALVNPDHPNELCDDIERKTGVPTVLMDANDIQRDQLGRSQGVPLTDTELQDAMHDNPSGQGDELTPLILIRPIS